MPSIAYNLVSFSTKKMYLIRQQFYGSRKAHQLSMVISRSCLPDCFLTCLMSRRACRKGYSGNINAVQHAVFATIWVGHYTVGAFFFFVSFSSYCDADPDVTNLIQRLWLRIKLNKWDVKNVFRK